MIFYTFMVRFVSVIIDDGRFDYKIKYKLDFKNEVFAVNLYLRLKSTGPDSFPNYHPKYRFHSSYKAAASKDKLDEYVEKLRGELDEAHEEYKEKDRVKQKQ